MHRRIRTNKLSKLSQAGMLHHILPLIVVVAVGIIGTALLVAGHADTPSTPALVPAPLGLAQLAQLTDGTLPQPQDPLTDPVDSDNATKRLTSQYWGGYVDSSATFRQAQGTFRIPTVNCNAPANHAYPMALWVGFDGAGKGIKTVEQTGVAISCAGPKLVLQTWWQTYPGAPHYVTPGKLSLAQGDEVTATVTYEGNNEYEFQLYDNRNGHWFGVERPCYAGSVCQRATAEWIAESTAPGDVTDPKPITFSTTNTLYFTSGTAIVNGPKRPISYFKHSPINLVRGKDGQKKTWLYTDYLNRASGGTAFTIQEHR